MPERRSRIQAPSRVLVIDDEPETAGILRAWFRDEAWDILWSPDGEEGLSVAAAEKPDLILLDLRMPGLDGLAVARGLKSNPETQSIPVILLSASKETKDKVEAFRAGVDDYVTKPFAAEEVDARIRAMLRKRDLYIQLDSAKQALQTTNRQLEEMLIVDEKTKLATFRHFQRRLSEEWLRAQRYGTPLSLVMLDLDDFKRLNDSLGHPAGDRALRECAALVMGGARQTDLPARYGGEEFAIILPHTDGEMAVRVADRIRRAVRENVFLENETPTRLTISAGTATYPSHPGVDSAESLLRAADRALLCAKQEGKDRVVSDDGTPPAQVIPFPKRSGV